jgi:hypothetical protein
MCLTSHTHEITNTYWVTINLTQYGKYEPILQMARR